MYYYFIGNNINPLIVTLLTNNVFLILKRPRGGLFLFRYILDLIIRIILLFDALEHASLLIFHIIMQLV